MDHPALAVHPAQNAHGQTGVAHSPGPASMHQEPRRSPCLEEPGRAGVKVHADEVQRRAALLVAFQGQCHVDKAGGQLRREARLQQPGRELGGQVAVHGGRAARAHAVAQNHLGCGRAAELLHRIARDAALRCRARRPKHGPEGRLLAEQQGGHPFAGEYLRGFQRAAAKPAHLLGQRIQLGGLEPGAGQSHRRPGAAQIVQRDRTLQRRRPQRSEKRRHPARFIGFRLAGAAQLLTQDPQRIGHGAVLLGEGGAHGLGVDEGLFPAAVECEGSCYRRAEGRRVDAPYQLARQVGRGHAPLLLQHRAQRFQPLQHDGVLLLPAFFTPPAVEAEGIVGVVDDPAEALAPPGKCVIDVVDRLRQRGKALGHGFQPGGSYGEPGPLLLRRVGRRVFGAHRGAPRLGQEPDRPHPDARAEKDAKGLSGRLDAEGSQQAPARVGSRALDPPARGQQGSGSRPAAKAHGGQRKGGVGPAEGKPRPAAKGQRRFGLGPAAEQQLHARADGHAHSKGPPCQAPQRSGSGQSCQQRTRAPLFGREAPQADSQRPRQQRICPAGQQKCRAAALGPEGKAERPGTQRSAKGQRRRDKPAGPEPPGPDEGPQPAEQADALEAERPKPMEQQPQRRPGRAGGKAVLPKAQRQPRAKGQQRAVQHGPAARKPHGQRPHLPQRGPQQCPCAQGRRKPPQAVVRPHPHRFLHTKRSPLSGGDLRCVFCFPRPLHIL